MEPYITPQKLKKLLDTQSDVTLIDVREHGERELVNIGGQHILMNDIPEHIDDFEKNQHLVIYCHHGIRSATIVNYLRQHGFSRVQNLTGGIDAWSALIDNTVPRY